MDLRLNCVEHQDDTALKHPPLVESKVVKVVWNPSIVWNTQSCECGLLPEASSSFVCSESINADEHDNALHRSRDKSESKGFSVVFVPCLYVKGQKSCKISVTQRVCIAHRNIHPNKVKTVFQPIPKFCEAAKMRHSRDVLTASTPWSKSSPRGPLWCVRRLQMISTKSAF